MAGWSVVRRAMHNFLYLDITEQALGFVIFVNLALIIVETDAAADEATIEFSEPPHGIPIDGITNFGAPSWVERSNKGLMGIYTVELCTRLFVLRKSFFLDSWCVMDFFIVGSDIVLFLLSSILGDMPKIAILRVFRLLRLARAFKALSKFPELALLLRGFACALKAIFWGILLVLIVLTIWSILAVQMVHPINIVVANRGLYEGCERCPRAFSSVWNSLCTFTQQLVAGDSWGTVSLPIIEESWPIFYFFLAVLVSVSLAIMNLILAVIVDSATEARQEALAGEMAIKELEFQKATEHFTLLCKELDADGSGCLTAQELISGFDRSEEFAETMGIMGLRKEDMAVIFNALDRDSSGEVNYQEFVTEMNNMRNADTHTMLQFIQFYVTDMQSTTRRIAQATCPPGTLVEGTEVMPALEAQEAGSKSPRNAAASVPQVLPTGAWEPLPKEEPEPLFSAQASATGQRGATNDALTELKRVNQELVYVMKQMVERTEAHTRILTNLGGALPAMQGTQGSWVPLEGLAMNAGLIGVGGDEKGAASTPFGGNGGRNPPPRDASRDRSWPQSREGARPGNLPPGPCKL